MKSVAPLGKPNPHRYEEMWPAALLQRMLWWVRQVHQGGWLLDVGCGEGVLLDSLGWRKGVGVDLNPERAYLAASKGLSVCVGQGEKLPFLTGAFDTVVAMEVLEHVPDMRPLLGEIYRVLKQGGALVLSVPNVTLRSLYEMWREKRPYYCDAAEHYREFSPVEIPWFEHKFERLKNLERICAVSGFTIKARDGVRYLFPQWFSRWKGLQEAIESPKRDRLWAKIPLISSFPYWRILVLERK